MFKYDKTNSGVVVLLLLDVMFSKGGGAMFVPFAAPEDRQTIRQRCELVLFITRKGEQCGHIIIIIIIINIFIIIIIIIIIIITKRRATWAYYYYQNHTYATTHAKSHMLTTTHSAPPDKQTVRLA